MSLESGLRREKKPGEMEVYIKIWCTHESSWPACLRPISLASPRLEASFLHLHSITAKGTCVLFAHWLQHLLSFAQGMPSALE